MYLPVINNLPYLLCSVSNVTLSSGREKEREGVRMTK